MQVEMVQRLFTLTEDGYRSNNRADFSDPCSPNVIEEYGAGIYSFKSICAADYSYYHENN